MIQPKTFSPAKRVSASLLFVLMAFALVAGAITLSATVAKADPADSTQTASTASGDTVRVAFFPLNGFYDYDANGNMTGYGVDYFNAVADSAGIKYEYVPAASWVEALDMFDKGQVDVLAPSEMTAERSEKYRFCPLPIGTEYGALLTLNTNDSLTYEDYASFNGKKVGCVQSIIFMNSYLDYQKNNGFDTQLVYYKDTPALTAALNAGEVDAMLVNLMVKTDTTKVLAKFGAAPIYFLVGADNAQLQETLNNALNSFASSNPSFQSDLTNKYFASFSESPFTKQELSFAASCDTVNVGIPSDEAPLSHIDETGEPCGLDVEVLNAIGEESGLKFNFVTLPNGNLDESFLVDNDIALVAGMESNVETTRTTGITLSKPFQTLSKVYVGKPSESYDVEAPIKVAVTARSETDLTNLSAKHPNFDITQYDTTEECLHAAQDGKVDVVLQNRYLVERCLSNPHFEDLSILPFEGVSTDYAFGLVDQVVASSYSDDGSELFKSVIDKSISQIPVQTVDGMLSTEVAENQYKPTFFDMVYQFRLPLLIIAIALIIVIASLVYAMRVKEHNNRRIQDNEQKLSNITNNINGGVLVINSDDSLLITFANDGFLELIGCSRESFEEEHHNSYTTYVHPGDIDKLREIASAPIGETGERVSLPLRLRREDGSFIDTLFNGTIRNTSDGTRQMYCVVTDISEQLRLLNELTLEKKRADLFFQKSDNVIYEVNLQDKSIIASDNMLSMLGWTLPTEIVTMSGDFLKSMWRTDEESKEKILASSRKLINERVDVKCTVPLQNSKGGNIWCEINQYPVVDANGDLVSVVGRILDVDTAVAERERLERLARTDSMTGLLKKEPFVHEVRSYLADNHQGNCALLFFDVDKFKEVNDTLGHELGDECLKDVAHKLNVAFSGLDLIGRFGGDEFVVFVKNIPHNTLIDKLEWLEERLKETYDGDSVSLTISCSIGAACTQEFGRNYDALLQHADAALYEAKGRGRAQFVLATPE